MSGKRPSPQRKKAPSQTPLPTHGSIEIGCISGVERQKRLPRVDGWAAAHFMALSDNKSIAATERVPLGLATSVYRLINRLPVLRIPSSVILHTLQDRLTRTR